MNYIKHASIKFSCKNHLTRKELTYERLLMAARQNGYIVKHYSTAAMQLVMLDLYERAKRSSAVSCVDENGNVCIFIDDSMHRDKRLFALAHEIGHIVLQHKPASDKKAKLRQEREANLFAHYLTMRSEQRMSKAINIVSVILLCCVMGILIIAASTINKIEATNYYVETGRAGEINYITDSTVCYWVERGMVYHTYSDCWYLRKSECVFETTIGECGKERQCLLCETRHKEQKYADPD